MAASTVHATVIAAATASPLRNPSPRVNRPSRAMNTVPAANRTARPDVLSASTADRCGSSLDCTARRYLVTMNKA